MFVFLFQFNWNVFLVTLWNSCFVYFVALTKHTLVARFMGPTWGSPGACCPHELCYLGTFEWIKVSIVLLNSNSCNCYILFCIHWVMTKNLDIFSLVAIVIGGHWKHHKYPCFCIIPLEFGGIVDIYTYLHSMVLCWNCNRYSLKMHGHSELHIHRNHIGTFHLNQCLW